MTDNEEIELVTKNRKEIVSSMIKWIVGVAGTCVLALIVFYFNTTYVLAQTVKDTTENTVTIKKIEKTVNDLKVIPKLNSQKIENIEDDVSELKTDVKDIRKNQQKILELLYQIKQNQND